MKLKIKSILIMALCMAAITFITGCRADETPYEINNEENYTVSVKYDANGGIFTTNTSVIVDSYNVTDMSKNGDGLVEIALLSPDDSNRGNDAFTAINNGHFLAGWYEQRTEVKDSDGNVSYTYSDKWDFENGLLKIDPTKEYNAEEPVITLYAAWVPLFKYEFYTVGTDELVGSYSFDPGVEKELSVPKWDEETGAIEMFKFAEKSGYTFNNAYYENSTDPINSETVVHPGYVDEKTGLAVDPVLKIYVDWLEGEWYRISNVEQLLDNASVKGCYDIIADLDFEGENWPTAFMTGNFAGEFRGNGHTIKNVEFVYNNNSKVNAGLFGNLTENSRISDLTFENINFTIKASMLKVDTGLGLFAGNISNNAQISNVKVLNGTINIDSGCHFGINNYFIGLVCGVGDPNVVDEASIVCKVTGDNPENLIVSVEGNEVTVVEAE